jgi:hypothetical protein
MSNVLPQEARKRMWRMYRGRFIIAALLMLLGLALLSAIALVPSYFALMNGGNTPAQQDLPASSALLDRAAIAHTQTLITTLLPLLSSTSTNTLINKALALRPSGLFIEHITASKGEPGTITLSGEASNIGAISAYQNTLRTDGDFIDASVPVGDLVGTGGGQFTLTLTANF